MIIFYIKMLNKSFINLKTYFMKLILIGLCKIKKDKFGIFQFMMLKIVWKKLNMILKN